MSFAAHASLLDRFLTARRPIVERIERALLNVRDKSLAKSRNRAQFAHLLDLCFWGLPGLPHELTRLKGDLAARHRADGFEPVQLDAFVNELDPLELIVRAYGHWEATRWPGATGRLAFADTIFSVCLLRQLEHLSVRIWDDGRDGAAPRLAEAQRLLDELNAHSVGCVLVRDARWLIQTGLGPFTKHLRPYFVVADHIAASFADDTRLAIHSAGARLAGGHLRSQLRYRMWQTGLPVDDSENLAFTRNSNALDNALLVRDLVPLLRAYRTHCAQGDATGRRELADAVLQGLSVDPDLFVSRFDLLAPYAMIEDLFIGSDGGALIRRTALGSEQQAWQEEYCQLLGDAAAALRTDADGLDPAACGYSPLGITYGFCADVMSNIAVDTLVGRPSFGLTLEDLFVSRDRADDKLARAHGWQLLPRRPGESAHFDYSEGYAGEVFTWLTAALEARAARPTVANASARRQARLIVAPVLPSGDSGPASLPEHAAPADAYRLDTNATRAAETGAIPWPAQQFATDRVEGRLLASAEVDGAWLGISKIVLTRLIGAGTDAVLTHLPPDVVNRLALTCPDLLDRARES